jgi:hypothetical protein
MLTCLDIHDALGIAAATYAAQALTAPQALPILPLQTLRAGCCGDLVPLLQLLQPSVAPTLAEIDFAFTDVTPEAAIALATLTHCTSLSMEVRSLDDAHLHQLLASMPQLRRLRMVDPGRFYGDKYTQWALGQLADDVAPSSKDRRQQQPRLKHQALCPNVRRLSGVGGSLWQRLVFPRSRLDPEYYDPRHDIQVHTWHLWV